jgi:hypothetical protein
MPITIETKAYAFDELSDAAKEKARSWYRECMTQDNDLSERNYDDFVECATRLGIDFDQREGGKFFDGTINYRPTIYWSGFCSQGDGACFEGSYAYKATAPAAIREHAPKDETLRELADRLTTIQLRNAFGLRATVKHSGHYYHEHSMDIDVTDARNEDRDIGEDAEHIAEAMRDFARWMYGQLDADNDYLYSDECVDECITANEYMFDEEGDRHAYA